MSERKGVLLRFEPHLLERVDALRGAQNRTEFLLAAITAHLDELETPEPNPLPVTHMLAGAEDRTRVGLFARTASMSVDGEPVAVSGVEVGLKPGSRVRVLDGENGDMGLPAGVVAADGHTIEFHKEIGAGSAAGAGFGAGPTPTELASDEGAHADSRATTSEDSQDTRESGLDGEPFGDPADVGGELEGPDASSPSLEDSPDAGELQEPPGTSGEAVREGFVVVPEADADLGEPGRPDTSSPDFSGDWE